MTYSQLINIKSKKLEINYNFSINKHLKFRFITPENLNGVQLNTQHVAVVNNFETNNEFWYRHTRDLEFTNLDKYMHLVLQLYSDEDFRDYKLQENNTFTITNKNDWFVCSNTSSSCDINFFNQEININKPIQEVNEYLKYKITGDATIKKNKYIQVGKGTSMIEISGFEPNTINYISFFELKKPDNKTLKSVNKYTNIDTTHQDFNGINNINDKIEMIKFQLKNYFLENNQDMDRLDTKIIKNEEKSNSLESNINKVKTTLEKYTRDFDAIDKNVQEIYVIFKEVSENVMPFDEKINSLFIITDNLIKTNQNFNDNISNIETELNKISELHEDINNKISKISEEIVEKEINSLRDSLNKKIENLSSIFNDITNDLKDEFNKKLNDHIIDYTKNINKNNENNDSIIENISVISKKLNKLNDYNILSKNKLNEIIKNINDLSITSNVFSEKLIEYENKISTIDNKLEELIENKSSYVWSNKLDENSIIEFHKTYLSLNYDPNNISYKTENFYIFKDKQGIVIPYYCWKIKYINYCLSNVKFISLIPIDNIV